MTAPDELLSSPATRDGVVHTYCRICEPLCGMRVTVADGIVQSIAGDPDHPSSRGYLCPKGSSMAAVAYDPDRVTRPLKRTGGPGEFEEVGWEEALDDIAARLRRIVDAHGPESAAMYFGNPGAYSIGNMTWSSAFLSGLGSTNKYTALHQDTGGRYLASHFLYGNGAVFPLPDLAHTSLLLMFGANPLVSHGSLVSVGRIREELAAIERRGGRVMVVDPVRTKTAAAHEHLPIVPGTDVWLLGAMVNEVFRLGLDDPERTTQLAEGVDSLREAIGALDVATASHHTGIPEEQITQLAVDFASAPSAVAYGRTGVCRNRYTTLTNYLLDALNIVTGNFDRRGGIVFGRGVVDTFALWGELKRGGYGTNRTRIGDLPDLLGMRPYVLPQEILTPGDGQIRALFCCAGNPVLAAPDGALLEEAMEDLELSVAIDMYMTETAKHAHYLLPGTTFLERFDSQLFFQGSMLRPWAQATGPVIEPVGLARPEWWIFDQLMHRLGLATPASSPQEYVDRLLRDHPADPDASWSLARLAEHEHGVLIGEDVKVGDARERLALLTGGAKDKAQLGAPEILAEVERLLREPDRDPATLLMVSRRDLRSINSWLHNVRPVRDRTIPVLFVHPDDADERAIADGSAVRITSRTASIDVEAAVTTDVTRGTVSYPHGWGHAGGWSTANRHGGANYNLLISSDVADKEALSGASLIDAVEVTLTPL